MTNLTRPRMTAGTLAVAGLLLTGCGTGDDASTDDVELGPISQRVAALEEQFDADVLTAQSNALEEKVADCMKDQGFDYTPQMQSSAALAASLDLPDQNTVEFAKQYGYGITTWDDVAGTADSSTDQPSAQESTPEYQAALLGKDYLASGGTQAPGGCMGEAMTEVFGDDVWSMDTTVADDIAALRSQADTDDQVVATLDGWVTCMGDAGYDYDTPDAAKSAIAARAYSSPTGGLVTGEALSTLRTEEIDTAVADMECRDSSGLTQARAQALAAAETGYYATHKAEVDAYLDQLEQMLTEQ